MAFATGASLAALALVAADTWRPHWTLSYTALLHAAVILCGGAACALLAIFAPPFARLFLRPSRSEGEVRQYAESLFLRRALFATGRRRAILILVSLFERRIEIVADSGCGDRVSHGDWQGIIARMTPRLRERNPAAALREALAAVETLLLSKGFAGGAQDEDDLPNQAIEEAGQ